jgi:copper homeostasis protein
MALLEIAVDSVDDGLQALDAGADRLEVCSALDVGGCTPPIEDFRRLRSATERPLFMMIRPRGGSFVYSDEEKETMLAMLRVCKKLGADGYVTGALTEEKRIDTLFMQAMIDISRDLPCTFHRAFDELPSPLAVLDDLLALGIRRVLTTGGAGSAEEGVSGLCSYAAHVGEAMQILPGGGVRPSNIERIIHETGVAEIHSSGRNDDNVLDGTSVSLMAGIAHAQGAS